MLKPSIHLPPVQPSGGTSPLPPNMTEEILQDSRPDHRNREMCSRQAILKLTAGDVCVCVQCVCVYVRDKREYLQVHVYMCVCCGTNYCLSSTVP